MGFVSNILLLMLIVLFVVIFYPEIIALVRNIGSLVSNLGSGSNFNFPNSSNVHSGQAVNSTAIVNYTLYLINKDRSNYGLSNVALSPIGSGQQHSESMLQNNYFSHWDIYGMKPYMRYTLLGGLESVQENVAYTSSGVKACLGSLCTNVGSINVTSSVKQMEYNMMYNDSACCNNGHRDNILDPNHNEVSIGIAYNKTSVYLVEDFINNYIKWLNNTPSISNKQIVLEGSLSQGYVLSSIEIGYDPPVLNMSTYQLDQTSEYSYGTAIAGVVNNPSYYYPTLTTIVADRYYQKGNDFFVSFNMTKLISSNAAGEYTVEVWLNGTRTNNSFVGSTYTIFVNQDGQIYIPFHI